MIDVRMSKAIFKFRVRMAQFSGNFMGQGLPEICPLCGPHSDLQELCLYYPSALKQVILMRNMKRFSNL